MIELVPPVIRILLDEDVSGLRRSSEVNRFLKKLLPELRQQAVWTFDHFEYTDHHPIPSRLVATTSGRLNPFDDTSTCSNPACRVQSAKHFATTAGLYADIVTVPDNLSAMLFMKDHLTARDLDHMANDLRVIKTLEPLIRAGIARFRRAAIPLCRVHI